MGIPGAVWNATERVWELVPRGTNGLRQGECRWFREDGSLAEVRRYVADLPDGPFTAYHPDGSMARQGTYAAGQLHGVMVAFASDSPTAEPLRACCVPPTARELRARYAHGRLLGEIFHDLEGRPLLLDGEPWPERPPGVPAETTLDEAEGRWVEGRTEPDGYRVGTFRFWTMEGRLTEESVYSDGSLTSTLLYGGDGALTEADAALSFEECGFTDEQVPHGAYRRRFAAADSPYADARIREEHGTFDHGRRVGIWTFLDGAGRTVAAFDLGVPLDEGRLADSPALATVSGTSGDATTKTLLSQRRLREALCVAATVAVARCDATRLSALLASARPQLKPKLAAERGEELVESGNQTVTSALEALVTGVDAAAVFRCLASVLDSAHPAALRFVDVSLLLEPARTMTHLTRALLRIEQGDDEGALADAAALAVVAPEAARAVREHVRLTFPDFSATAGFWPAAEDIQAAPDGGPTEIAQDQATILRGVQVYATRIALLRGMVRDQVGDRDPAPRWFPPFVGELLPEGLVPLRVEPGLDERMGLDRDAEGRAPSVAELLMAARADWSALSWLCWAVGLTRVTRPTALAPVGELGAAVATAVARCFRAHDRVLTGGVQGRAQGLPGFTWQGMDIDELSPHLARLPAAEYLAIRSMLLWLVLPDAESPFEAELRQA